jgi:ATP-binding cassette subfamily B protein
MSARLHELGWPVERLGEGVMLLARRSGLRTLVLDASPAPPPGLEPGLHLEAVVELLGLEAEEVATRHTEAREVFRWAGPALWLIPEGEGQKCLLLLGGTGHSVRVLGPDLVAHRLGMAEALSLVRGGREARHGAEVERLLALPAFRGHSREAVRAALLDGWPGDEAVGRCWVLRDAVDAPFTTQARRAGLHRGLALLLGAHSLQYGLWLLSWWVMGQGALHGRFDPGWMAAWGLLLLSMLPLRMLSTWMSSVLSVDAGALLKARLLAGALRLEPEEVRHQGAGQLLGKVLESEQVESLSTTGGAIAAVGLVELLLTGVVLWNGSGGLAHVLLLAGTVALLGVTAWRFYLDRERFSEQRTLMANGLVEQLLGHRTRLAQQHPERWHEGEEHELHDYLALSRAMDASAVTIQALVSRVWLLLSCGVLAPGFVSGAPLERLAVGVGGTLLVWQALRKVTPGLTQLTGAVVAWRQTRQLFEAARRVERPATLETALERAVPPQPGTPLLEGHGLVFRHAGRSVPVLEGCGLEIHAGDRLLLEGSSGAGKTTLGAILAGLRRPQSGLLLFQGLDRRTLGTGWRRAVAAAPQFHENHIFNGTLAFNLLMGCHWPPAPAELEKAEELCRALGLGPLLARMPDGLHQAVGETGWMLSHGEKSRIYIARTLLQGAGLLILDESFAALDPQTLRATLDEVFRRAPTLLVIAHP